MARIPQYQPTTRASSQGQQGLSVSYNAEMFGAGIGRAISSFADVAVQMEARKKETGRFEQLTTFSEFETQTKLGLEELKRDTELDEAQFYERAEAFFNDSEASYLNRVPAEHQEEFRFRSQQLKQGVVTEAYDFANKQRDAFYTQKIGEELQKSEIELAANPKKLEEFRARMIATIDATDLPEIQKEADKKRVQKQLEQLTFKNEIQERKEKQLLSPKGSSPRAFLNALYGPESGGRLDAANDVEGSGGRGHFGRVQFSQGRLQEAKAAGVIPANMTTAEFLKNESAQTAAEDWHIADIDAHIQRMGHLSKGYDLNGLRAIAHLGGKGGMDKYVASGGRYNPADANGTTLSMYYKRFAGLEEKPEYSDLDSNPAYSNLDLEERLALIRAGESAAIERYNSLVKEEAAATAAKLNDLQVGLFDGRYDESHILAARKDWLVDYEDINKAQNILDNKRKETNDLATGLSMLEQGQTFIPALETHRGALDALFGSDGETAMQERSSEYVQTVALPLFSRAGAMPKKMLDILTAQTMNQDGAVAAFAYETLSNLRRANQSAFATQVPEKLQAELDAWETKVPFTPSDQIAAQIQNRASTPEQRQQQMLLKTEARELLKEIDVQDDVASNIRDWSGYWQSDNVSPATYSAMSNDFSMLFEEEFVRYGGDAEAAKAAATRRLGQVWGRNEVDGTPMMKLPPNLAGYPKLNDSYDWIKDEVNKDLKALGIEAASFKMVADNRTFKETAALKEAKARGEAVTYPAYRIIATMPNGLIMPVVGEDGKPIYFNFPLDEAKQTMLEQSFIKKREEALAEREFINTGSEFFGGN